MKKIIFIFFTPQVIFIIVLFLCRWIAFLFAFGTLIIMACFGDARRNPPLNYIFLLIFTVAQSFLVGVSVSRHETEAVSIINNI